MIGGHSPVPSPPPLGSATGNELFKVKNTNEYEF